MVGSSNTLGTAVYGLNVATERIDLEPWINNSKYRDSTENLHIVPVLGD